MEKALLIFWAAVCLIGGGWWLRFLSELSVPVTSSLGKAMAYGFGISALLIGLLCFQSLYWHLKDCQRYKL